MDLTRRDVIVGASALSATVATNALAAVLPARKRVMRIAHLTDIHIQPERQAGKGLLACLEHVQSRKDRVDVVFTGGDLIMDALGAEKDRVDTQWKLFHQVMRECELPVEHCIGNHDVWGWSDRAKFGTESGFGKIRVMEELKLVKPYRSFDRAGWHFIVLDSTHPKEGNGYTAKLDEEQFEWLTDDLAKTPKNKPVFILSHIPIIAACAYFDGDNEKSGNWQVPGAWMHIDARRLKDLFKQHPNVKLCVSGHEHLLDRVDYLGVSYVCNGAVSGGWWGGNYQECNPGYTVIELFNDGSFTNQYVEFGWTPKA